MINQEVIRQKLPSSRRREKGTHAGLWLDKHMLNQSRVKENTSRRDLINGAVELPEPPEYAAFYRRWEATFQKENIQTRKVRVRGRMVVGLGSESVLEASIKGLDAMAYRDVAGQIHGYYQKWPLLTLQEARLLLAQAIVDKIEQAGRTKQTAEKAWYKDLRTFLDEHEKR